MKSSLAFKHVFAVAAFAAAGLANAVASTTDYQLPLGSSLPVSVLAPGSEPFLFQNTFGFNVSSPSSLSGSVVSTAMNIYFLAVQAINFNGVSLNPSSLTSLVSPDTHSVTFSAANLAAGNYVLTVSGLAQPALGFAQPAAYGNYSIAASLAPVPEPESYAMFLAGLGVIGAVATRRRKSI